MIKLIVSIILAFLLSAGVSNMEILLQNDKRSFKDFDEISVCGSIEVELIQAD